MKSKKMVIGYAIAIFLLVFVITFNSVCSITQFDVRFDTGSAGASASAEKVQDRLDAYLKKSYLFFSEEKVYGIVADVCKEDGTYLKVLSVKKHFPNKVSVRVEEEYESYAFSAGGQYYVTDADGKLLKVKDSAASNIGGENIVISGAFTFSSAEAGTALICDQEETFSLLLRLLSAADAALGGVRGRFSAVEYIVRSGTEFFRFAFTEGVEIWLTNVGAENNETEARFAAALTAYAGLSDAEKTYGYLMPSGSDPDAVPEHNPGEYDLAG